MNELTRILGFPHELLHLLALRVIGRRAVSWTRTHVDIPDDLTDNQYVFVAGLPALVFVILALLGMYAVATAQTYPQSILAIVVMVFGTLSLSGTAGDLQLIADRFASKK